MKNNTNVQSSKKHILATAILTLTLAVHADDTADAWAELVHSANWMEGAYAEIAVMAEVLMLAKNQYVDPKETRELMHGAIHGILSRLDPYSLFLEEEDLEEQLEEMEGSFHGIGVTAFLRDGGPVVEAVKDESPAKKAGILPGDRIVSVDGKTTQGMTMKDVIRAFRGPLGSKVRVGIERENGAFEATLERADIEVQTVWPRMLDDGMLLVRISHFNEKTGKDFQFVVAAFEQTFKATTMILDLRDNPGGVVHAAGDAAEILFTGGTHFVTLRGRDDKNEKFSTFGLPPRTREGSQYTKMPMVVLVNEKTASAAEILAGALQDHRRAVIVGERTLGKASIQQVARLQLRPEVGVRLTVARYFTPNGRMIQGEGITPDIVVEKDEALGRALEILKAAKIFLKEEK